MGTSRREAYYSGDRIVDHADLSGAAAAQTGSSTIAGVVKDESGGAVPGAAIKVVNEATGVGVDAFSNEQGLYEVAGLVPGQYRVKATLDGFETVSQRIALERARLRRSQSLCPRRDSPKALW